jgi:hypothetical protein
VTEGLTELATCDIELMEEEPGPSKQSIQKLKHVIGRQERCEQLDACVTEGDSDADEF